MTERDLKNKIECEYYHSKSKQSQYKSRILNGKSDLTIEEYKILLESEKQKSKELLKMLV